MKISYNTIYNLANKYKEDEEITRCYKTIMKEYIKEIGKLNFVKIEDIIKRHSKKIKKMIKKKG